LVNPMSNKSLNPIVSIIFALQVCSIFAMAEDEGTRDTSLDVQAAPNCSYIGNGSVLSAQPPHKLGQSLSQQVC
jgi:hypothetical protein